MDWKRDLLVCPGGDRDTWRPYKQRYAVHLAGRTGYARLALRTGTPVTPVAKGGAHESLVVLTDGRRFARRMHLQKRFRAELFPVHLSLPGGLGVGPLSHLPWPVHLRYRFGPPAALPTDLAPDQEPSEALVLAYDAEVRGALQRLLDGLEGEAEPVGERIARMGRVVRRWTGRRAESRAAARAAVQALA